LAESKRDLSIAIVGFGSAGKMALNKLSALVPNARFLIVSGHQEEVRQANFTPRISDVSDFSPDAVLVTGPASDRLDVIAKLQGVSVPLFIEKPLAGTLQDAYSILTQLKVGTNACQLGYNLRFSTSLEFFRNYMQQERKGKVKRFIAETGQYLPDWRPDRDYRDTVSARSDRGGGVLLELSHEIDYLRWIFGEWDWVSAWTGNVSALDIDVEDTALITVGIKSESAGEQSLGQLSLDFVRRDKTRSVTAVCELGTVRWDGIAGRVEERDAMNGRWETLAEDQTDESTYEAQWASFLKVVESGAMPEVSLEDGVEVLRAIEAIRHSNLRSGKRTFLSEVGL